MDRVISSVSTIITACVFSTATFAFMDFNFDAIKPNLGADVGIVSQDFQDYFGKDHFSRHHGGTNFYVGAVICQYLGVEAGYEHMYRKQRWQYYDELLPVLGFVNPNNDEPATYFADVFAQTWHLNLLGIWPVCPNTFLTASIGIAWSQMDFETLAVNSNIVSSPVSRWHSDHEALLRLSIGVRQMITQCFGTRLQVVWENASQLSSTVTAPQILRAATDPIGQEDNYTARAGNRYNVMLGFFLQFT